MTLLERCIDCEREFSLVTEKQRQRWVARGGRCPTCGFNFMNKDIMGFVPKKI